MFKDSQKDHEKLSSYTRLLLHVATLSENRESSVKEINELNAKLKQMAIDAAEEDKKKNEELLRRYEEIIGQLRQKHLQNIDGMLRSLAEKDKRLAAQQSQMQALQINYTTLENQLQATKATLAVMRGENKTDYKK